jgi:hypothetical protein
MSLSRTEDAKSLEAALTRIDEAQRLAGPAQSECERSGRRRREAIGDVLRRMPTR